MKILCINMALLFCLLTPAWADDFTYADTEPRIQRLQGVVLYPYEIEVIETDHGPGYRYKLLRLRDTGQAIQQDRARFAADNRAAIAEQLYSFSDLVESQKAAELDSTITDELTAPIQQIDVKELMD